MNCLHVVLLSVIHSKGFFLSWTELLIKTRDKIIVLARDTDAAANSSPDADGGPLSRNGNREVEAMRSRLLLLEQRELHIQELTEQFLVSFDHYSITVLVSL